ncbi:DMT family transporter [Alteribacter aurantiacus]|uniref:DMT family transporter n=1 Tax=Alteribacter aurantiacus TaxID=254410 RepID=UPI000411D84C|nr:DMT family transporter [Alteribacter aurantiacus]
MVVGLILAATAGAAISLQTVFNNKVNEKTGSWTTTTLALGMGFVFALVASIMAGEFSRIQLGQIDLWYWFAGVTGVGVVFCLVQAMKRLGPTVTISIVMTAQLSTALIWDSFGWMGIEKIPFSMTKLAGILMIIAGVLVFKMRSKEKADLMEVENKKRMLG